MGVNSYLMRIASSAVLSSYEKEAIRLSIMTLEDRLDSYFGSKLTEHFTFGSYTRSTILPRSIDSNSDIDYMIVFTESGSKPQTYIDRLRRFAEKRYSTSDIAKSSPTVVLDLNHIRFELVPALAYFQGTYSIPAPSTLFTEWMGTTPKSIDDALAKINNRHSSLIKPMVRLFKYWNARSGYVFNSFELEQFITERYFEPSSNLKELLFNAFDQISLPFHVAQWRTEKLSRANDIISNVRIYEQYGNFAAAEREIEKLIPNL